MDQNYAQQSSQQYPQQPINTPVTPIIPTPEVQKEHKKVGPIIAILVVVLILIIAALYAFGSLLNKNQTPPLNPASSVVGQAVTPASSSIPSTTQTVAPITNNADDPQSLQNDLNAATQGVDSQNF